jgi:hypothetical protein
MTTQADPPPSLLSFEAPLLASGPAAVAQAAAVGARRLALKGAEAGLEDIINSMLPPRCVVLLRVGGGPLMAVPLRAAVEGSRRASVGCRSRWRSQPAAACRRRRSS